MTRTSEWYNLMALDIRAAADHYERIDRIMDDKVEDACHVAGFEVD